MHSSFRCFLIDNDSEDQEIFSLALRELNPSINCIFADGGIPAIRKLTEDPSFRPDLIFIDMNMPLMNGIECLREIRKFKHLNQVPTYLYSTASTENLIKEAKRLGAVEFILKPASFKALTDLLAKLLAKHQGKEAS